MFQSGMIAQSCSLSALLAFIRTAFGEAGVDPDVEIDTRDAPTMT